MTRRSLLSLVLVAPAVALVESLAPLVAPLAKSLPPGEKSIALFDGPRIKGYKRCVFWDNVGHKSIAGQIPMSWELGTEFLGLTVLMMEC